MHVFPPSGGNKGTSNPTLGDGQQQETQSNALVLFGDVLDVELESYVLPTEHAVTSPGAWQKRNPTYRYEQGSPVAWEKTKPNCYSLVGSVRSFHPSWDGNPSSKSKERSAPEGGEGHQKWVGAPPVGYESGQTSNQNDGEGLEQVSAPMGFVEALVKEINSEIPGADEEIRATRGEEGAQPKENKSVAARMTPTAGIGFAQVVCILLLVYTCTFYFWCTPKTGGDNGGDCGKRHRMRSSKISGVYTPDPRVKKLFKSEEKVEYKPIAKTIEHNLRSLRNFEGKPRSDKMWDIATGHSVCNHFFLEIAEPGKWILLGQHMHVIMNMLWRRRGIYLQKERMVILDQYFIKTIQSNWSAFSADNDKLQFEWGKNLAQYVTGKSKGQKMKLGLGRDVDTVYTPMNWGGDHWVGLCIKLTEGHVTVFDSYVPHTEIEVKEGLRIYSWSRAEGIYHNKRGGDYGPCAAKFIEMHAAGLTEEMSWITDKDVDRFREQYAMDCYEEFVGDAKVNNE
uniref:Ubiquitin-like protease family profile domain-containing protein n=1 Tax=Brassica oleracea TaxID=3712 RepID=A0A3P6EHI2_BRAOL|nr:unnamed protein product [Brassica oleracea]